MLRNLKKVVAKFLKTSNDSHCKQNAMFWTCGNVLKSPQTNKNKAYPSKI